LPPILAKGPGAVSGCVYVTEGGEGLHSETLAAELDNDPKRPRFLKKSPQSVGEPGAGLSQALALRHSLGLPCKLGF
jgi:hypothetical protein